MTDLEMLLGGCRIIVTTKTVQNRKHRKKRINKKWNKRYGIRTVDIQKDGHIVSFENNLLMNQTTYELLMRNVKTERKEIE